MRSLLAWRMAVHSKVRTILAVLGATLAILLIFMELGFYGSVLNGATQIFDRLDYDLMITSREYSYLARAGTFPRRRVFQARQLSSVASSSPFYTGFAMWVDGNARVLRSIFAMGFRLSDGIFDEPDINRKLEQLAQPDTMLVDRATRAVFGPQTTGRQVEVGGRQVTIQGQYSIGTGFIELGTLVVSDQNFHRMFNNRTLDDVSLGLVKLREGVNPDEAARQLELLLPDDVHVLTRKQLTRQEQRYWVVNTSTGMIFGFGVLIAFIVGTVILYQTLSSQILSQLPRLATMKAIGFSNGYLAIMIIEQALFLVGVGFVPGLILALFLYRFVSYAIYLPIHMTLTRVVFVFVMSIGMSVLSGLLALRKAQKADPADLM